MTRAMMQLLKAARAHSTTEAFPVYCHSLAIDLYSLVNPGATRAKSLDIVVVVTCVVQTILG